MAVIDAGTSAGSEGADGRDGVRPALHEMWASVAPAWSKNAAFIDARLGSVVDTMLDLSHAGPGGRVLELACGPGGVGLAAAPRVAPGEVVLSDVVPEMTAIAAARAKALGLSNVSTRELDLERIEEPDSSYDVVLCRDGVMLVAEPLAAVREVRRVLRPGGRAVFAVWGPQDRNPWLGALFDAVTAHLGIPVPPPGLPGPFSLDDAGLVSTLLTDGGLSEVSVTELASPMRTSSFEEWWATVPASAGPLAEIIASLPDELRAAIRASAQEAISPYETPTGLDIPGVNLVATGRRL